MSWIKRLFARRKIYGELSEEIRAHVDEKVAELVESGMPREEASAAARRAFGNVMLAEERSREVWGWRWLEDLSGELRFGARLLKQFPAFTAVAVLTLALGIGANTAIFSLIDAVMLRSLPVEKPSELVLLKWSAREAPRVRGYMSWGDCPNNLRPGAANPSGCSFSEPMFREIAKTSEFSGVAAFASAGPLSLTGNGPASIVNGQLVSGDFFRTTGLKAAAGRVLEISDDSPTAAPVAVLSYGYWQSQFGGSQEALGRTIALNKVVFTIVGVSEARFTGISPGSNYDVWLPLAMGKRINSNPLMWSNREANPSFWWLAIVGRLKTETALPQTQAAISGLFRNEMLYGSVPQFDAAAGMPPSGGPAGPSMGGTTIQQRVVVGGPPSPDPGAPAPQPPPAGAGGNVVVQAAPAPPSGPPAGQSPSAASGVVQNEPPRQAMTLAKQDDEPAITLISAQRGLTGSGAQFANPLYLLMSAVGIILLIACFNVAGLMLSRSAARQKEIALRLALGAGRMRIVRQLLTESVMLATLGGILGIVFASWGARAILSFVSNNQPRPLGFATGLDWRVLGFTAVVTVFSGILFGLAPALRGVQVDLTPTLKEGSGGSSSLGHSRGTWFSVGNVLVVSQVALAIVVLVGAGLLVKTLRNLRSIDIGFDSSNLVIFGINPSLAGYKDAQVDSFYRDLQGRLAETPGVRSASYSMFPLLSGSMIKTMFHWPGTPPDRESESDMLEIGPGFFQAMQIPFVGGRDFNPSDYTLAANPAASGKVAAPVIVDQAFVAKYLGKENPLGKRFGEGPATDTEPASPGYEIIGVVRDTRYGNLRREINPMMYMPQSGTAASFEVRTAGDPQALVPAIREAVAQMDPNLPLRDVTTESQQIERLLFQERLVARLSGFFGLLALVLACIGLYGLLAYEVARRTREIGVRLALGAEAGDVLRLVVKQGLALALVGAVVGVGVALGVTRYLKAMLYDVNANDPVTLVLVALLLLLVALAACWIPARRATRVDPIVALRYE